MSSLSPALASVTDFSEFLHALRSRELARLPADARTVVSGGCAGEWYFAWFTEHFPGVVERHYGVELFADAPPGLPDNVVWLRQSLGSMNGVPTGEADLVFGGEVIEHLWPDDIAAFLAESWRVLRSGGTFALDSPNRVVVQPLRWTHAEHTLELSVAEIVELLGLAGFDDVAIRGVWLCYDREAHRLMPFDDLDGDHLDREQRVALAEERPEDAFVWWTHAVRGDRPPDTRALNARLAELFESYRPERLSRLIAAVPQRWDRDLGAVAVAPAGEPKVVFHGPYVPVPAGRWEACFRLSLPGRALDPATTVAGVDVLASGEPVVHRPVLGGELPAGGAVGEVRLPFSMDRTRMGIEFRLISSGRAVVEAPLAVTLRRHEPEPPSAPAPEPKNSRQTASAPARTIRRAASWPLRRFFDPRLALLHRKIEGVEARVLQRLDAVGRTPDPGPVPPARRLGAD